MGEGMKRAFAASRATDIVQTMSVPRLRRELKTLKGLEPQAPWMQKRVAEIEAELRVRASFHY